MPSQLLNLKSPILNVKGALPGTPLPVSAPQLNPAFTVDYTSYQKLLDRLYLMNLGYSIIK
jgi:hypothetical protein